MRADLAENTGLPDKSSEPAAIFNLNKSNASGYTQIMRIPGDTQRRCLSTPANAIAICQANTKSPPSGGDFVLSVVFFSCVHRSVPAQIQDRDCGQHQYDPNDGDCAHWLVEDE